MHGIKPFEIACKDDPHYKLIMENKPKEFWNKMIKTNPNVNSFKNGEFQSLVNGMLYPEAEMRFSILQI